MRTSFPRFLLLSLFVCFGMCLVYAQPATPRNSPYTIGEILNYEGKASKSIIRGISVADITFSVSKAPDGKNFLVQTEARSKGSLIKIFGLKFYQRLESTIDSENFRILKTVKHDEQDERVRNSEAIFDYSERSVTYVETDPNDLSRPPRKIASTIPNDTYDLISGIYIMRYLPLAVGKNFELNVSDSGLIYTVPVRVTARERQNTILGKVWCFRVEPQVFGEGRMIEGQKGSMIIWITDDSRHLPVRSQINTNLFRVEVKLRKIGK